MFSFFTNRVESERAVVVEPQTRGDNEIEIDARNATTRLSKEPICIIQSLTSGVPNEIVRADREHPRSPVRLALQSLGT